MFMCLYIHYGFAGSRSEIAVVVTVKILVAGGATLAALVYY